LTRKKKVYLKENSTGEKLKLFGAGEKMAQKKKTVPTYKR